MFEIIRYSLKYMFMKKLLTSIQIAAWVPSTGSSDAGNERRDDGDDGYGNHCDC